MIITRTPFRVSFFGGGSDYPAWTREHPGAVLASTINKYCYISCRYLPPFFEHRSRILYSRIEHVQQLDEIQHPSVRETLRFMNVNEGVEIHHDGDLPARTGLGSSSSFTVGLLHALHGLKGRMPKSKLDLAEQAIRIEQDILKENVGVQDQILAAFGGFNHVSFSPGKPISIAPVLVSDERRAALERHLMLVFTGFTRIASEVAREHIEQIPNRKAELRRMVELVGEALRVLDGKGDLAEFGKLLHESWTLKRGLTRNVSTSQIDTIYEKARQAGALGGKLLGAGGGGFMLFFARPEDQPALRRALEGLLVVPFRFEYAGSQIIFYDRASLVLDGPEPHE